MDQVRIRRALAQDTDLVAAMWNRASRWLAGRGYDQWQYPVTTKNIRHSIAKKALWIVEADWHPAGTVTLDKKADPRYWGESDDPHDALYVHRMLIERWASGVELGSALLDWAGRQAASRGRAWVRLDAWRSNTDLHQYYLSRGFELVRIVDDPNDPSGACFQRAATVQLGLGPRIIERA